MASLPMTSLATIRFAKRDIGQVQFSGPNANYMAALARLFDAAQVIGKFSYLAVKLQLLANTQQIKLLDRWKILGCDMQIKPRLALSLALVMPPNFSDSMFVDSFSQI
jgi:hypothetical protein